MELANHGLILLQQLNAQREFGFLCDCTVAIGDVFFKAHKAVLAAFSNYFRMLFIHQDRYVRNALGDATCSHVDAKLTQSHVIGNGELVAPSKNILCSFLTNIPHVAVNTR